jgi:hypothetical protein
LVLKKAAAIIVLSIFVLSQLGHHLVFELAKWEAKKIIKENIKTNKFEGVIEAIAENTCMSWEEKDQEFELNGQMYDVVKKEVQGKKIIYYCINDSKESNLLDVYNQWIHSDKTNTHQKNSGKLALKYSTLECILTHSVEGEMPAILLSGNFKYQAISFQNIHLSMDAPPPKDLI